MARFQLRCLSCGSRSEAELTELEEQSLRAQSHLTRFCVRCRGQTRWQGQAVASGSGFRAEYATPPPPQQASVLLI
ncbi:MAG: hypothetical protein L0099_15025, partial [Acidobacteria bacterium]|nr:hypothetical protein [Acidobacteriota bacterium]